MEPRLGELNLGFELAAVGLFVWASVDYNRFIKFWMIRPAPYSKLVRTLFRLFFLSCVVGGLWRVVEDVDHFRRAAYFCLTAILICALWLATWFLMVTVVEWMHLKLLGKRPNQRAPKH